MYPKNAASPEKIAIGPVVQISDGAVQTSGCTVRIIPSGVAEGDGAGTTSYSTDGVVLYTPTQAETNYASFILIAKKTGCIPACVTVVPTLSATAGQVVAADTQKVDLNTIKTQAVTCSGGVTIPAATLASTTNITAATGITVATNSDKTGYSLTATTGLGNQTANITGNLSGSVGSVTGAVGSVTGAVGSVTGNVGGNVTGSIGSLAQQAKDDVNAEVDTALNTAIPGSPTADSINQRIAAIDDLTQASGDGDLAAILTDTGTTLDGIVDAIKAKTDNLTFTSGTDLDVNVQKINDAALTGNGTSGTPWGPA